MAQFSGRDEGHASRCLDMKHTDATLWRIVLGKEHSHTLVTPNILPASFYKDWLVDT